LNAEFKLYSVFIDDRKLHGLLHFTCAYQLELRWAMFMVDWYNLAVLRWFLLLILVGGVT
jgi:hypothetical protein